ncbi:MAG: hypothetical protein AB8B55_14515 [Mariniblastus sp.]
MNIEKHFSFLIAGALLYCATLLVPNHTIAQENRTFQFDDVVYVLPDGWKKGKTRDGNVTIYNSDSGYRAIQIFSSDRVPRNLNRWVSKKIKSVLEDDKKIDKDAGDKLLPKEMWTSKSGEGLKGYLSTRISGPYVFVGVSAVGKKKVNFVLMKIRAPEGKEAGDLLKQRLSNEFFPFAQSLKFISEGAKPVLGKPADGDLEGTFTGLKYTTNLDLSTNFSQEFFTFSRSGRFVRGLPKGVSVNDIDFKEAVLKQQNRAGNYRVSGGKIFFEYADGTIVEKKFEKTEKGFKMNQNYFPVTIPPNGSKFDGLFNDLNYSGFSPGSGTTGGIVHQRTFRFSLSGDFVATQFSAVSGNFENGTGATTGGFSSSRKRPKVSGTYEVNDGKLLLTDARGKVAVCSLVQIGEKLLYVDGVQYLKSKSKKGN